MKHADQKLEQIQKQLKLDVEKLEQRIAPWGSGHHSGHGSGSGSGRSHKSDSSD